jgi:hypothetical protein
VDVTTIYTHCKPSSGSAPIYAFLTGWKGLAVGYAALLSLGQSTHNENVQLAQLKHQPLALFNFLFTSLIVLPIVLLITTYGSGLFVLVGILLLWSATIALLVIFAPLFHFELLLTRKNTEAANSLLASRPTSGDITSKPCRSARFILTSLDSMDKFHLQSYMLAFDRHLIVVKRRLLLMGGAPLESDGDSSRGVSRSREMSQSRVYKSGSKIGPRAKSPSHGNQLSVVAARVIQLKRNLLQSAKPSAVPPAISIATEISVSRATGEALSPTSAIVNQPRTQDPSRWRSPSNRLHVPFVGMSAVHSVPLFRVVSLTAASSPSGCRRLAISPPSRRPDCRHDPRTLLPSAQRDRCCSGAVGTIPGAPIDDLLSDIDVTGFPLSSSRRCSGFHLAHLVVAKCSW